MAILTPHFDLPFRFQNGSVAVVEQDTYADVANSVELIVRTPLGFRDDAPEFGFQHLEFDTQPLGTPDIVALIQSQEPRAEVIVEEKPDYFDPLIDRLRVEILEAGEF